eukprot:829325-Pyramimonas_sp.AAC.1
MARFASLQPAVLEGNPLLVALGFGQAFPSSSQEFLFAVLNRLCFPCGLHAAIRGLCSVVTAVGRADGIAKPLFRIRCGIIQGCALSGSLFAAATSPFLEDIRRGIEVPARGAFRACADDIGGIVFDMLDLKLLARVMAVAEKLANLKLKPP